MNQNNKLYHEDEIDLKELFFTFWDKKLLIVSITSIFAILSVIYALLLPNIYTSTTLLAPTKTDDSLTSQLGQFSSLARVSGISLPSKSGSRTQEAIERIKSFEFFSKYFLPNVMLENISAVKRWNPNSNQLIYEEKVFDNLSKKWLEDIPSEQEAFVIFNKALSITVDRKTEFVSISIDHKSPIIAKEWLDIIIYNINESMRLEDIDLAQNYINFLNKSQQVTNLQSLKVVASNLLENQMQTLMLASSSQAYIFKTINSPIIPELKSGPSRAIIYMAITIFGGFLSLLIVLIRHYFFVEDKQVSL